MNFNDLQRRTIGHDSLIMLIAMLAGVRLLVSLLGGMDLIPGNIITFSLPGNPDA